MNIENSIVGIIVLLSLIYVIRRLIIRLKNKKPENSACSGCPASKNGGSCH